LYKTEFVSTFNVTAPRKTLLHSLSEKLIFYYYIICLATVISFYHLLMNAAIFMGLAWYFDNLLSGETGTTRPPWFFLQPTFWGFNMRVSFSWVQRIAPPFLQTLMRRVFAEPSREEILAACENDDIRAEAERTLAAGNSSCRVLGLSKRYSSGLFSSSGLLAVDRLTFSIDEGQVLCLLGHNGVRRSLLKMLF
jgi:hypothetical protein